MVFSLMTSALGALNWNGRWMRLVSALIILVVGLAAFWIFGLTGGVAQRSQKAAAVVEMNETRAEADASLARLQAQRFENGR